MNDQPLVYEVSIGRADGNRGRRWRWSVTSLRKAEGKHPGVYDRREHMSGDFGYTYTSWGAYLAAGRTIRDLSRWDNP